MFDHWSDTNGTLMPNILPCKFDHAALTIFYLFIMQKDFRSSNFKPKLRDKHKINSFKFFKLLYYILWTRWKNEKLFTTSWIHFFLNSAHACLYLFFVILLSVALFTQPNGRVSTSYEGSKDVLRAVCEIGALLLTLMYLASEIYQMFV